MKKALFQTALTAYLLMLTCRHFRASCLAIAQNYSFMRSISHDAIRRFLQWKEHKWNIYLRQEFRHLLGNKHGYLIIDDTVVAKPFSKKLDLLSWVYSSSDKRSLYGFSCVLLVWTDGFIRIPLGVKFYDPATKKTRTKITLALELLKEARRYWKIKPQYVLFDAWYCAAQLLHRVRKYKWHFVTRLKSNRLLDGQSATKVLPYRYGNKVAHLKDGMRVLVVKDEDRFLATSKLTLSVQEVKEHYRQRQWIEETIKILKDELRLEDCSARSRKAQENHVWLCLVAFCLLEEQRVSSDQPCTIYQLRQQLQRSPIPSELQRHQRFIRAA